MKSKQVSIVYRAGHGASKAWCEVYLLPGEISFRPSFFELMMQAQFIAAAEREKYTGAGALREEMVRMFLRDALCEITTDEKRLRKMWIPLRIKYKLPRVGFEPAERAAMSAHEFIGLAFPGSEYDG